MLRELHPLTWEFHRNTSRWYHNIQDLPDSNSIEPPFKEYTNAPFTVLPDWEPADISIKELITNRYSCRSFKKEPISINALATILKGGYGTINRSFLDGAEFFERAVPSGGGLYSLEAYVLSSRIEGLDPGIYHYAAQHHLLEEINKVELSRSMVSNLFMNQPYMADAPAIIIITSCFERNMIKYGDRGYRYIMFEAGHCIQNMNLLASGLGLGTLNMGGFFDSDLATLLDIDIETEIPLYCMALGVPAEGNKIKLRMPDK